MLRIATRDDIPAMFRVRMAVKENLLNPGSISERDVIPAIETTGRGWVVELHGEVVAFAIGNAQTGNIWALFVDPHCERSGHGRLLLEEMVRWLWSQNLTELWLTTDPGTRASRFYESAGWISAGMTVDGELRYELHKG